MNTKKELLYNLLFKQTITGEIDYPRIPPKSDLYKLIDLKNIDDVKPLLNLELFDELNFDTLNTAFKSVVDDFNLLYSSINKQSMDVMNQLTNSLKEYRGITRSLNRINQSAVDIINGRADINKYTYKYTETFTNADNINEFLSTKDSSTKLPVIDIESGTMYIPSNTLNLIDLHHYYGTKLNVRFSNYNGMITKTKVLSNYDMSIILDPLLHPDDKYVYYVETNKPTPLTMSFVIQLNPDSSKSEISGVAFSIDSAVTGGYLRLDYKDETGWKPFNYAIKQLTPGLDDYAITLSDVINTSHIRFSIIKEFPDELKNLGYYLSIKNISIYKSTTSKTAVLVSKSTEIKSYGFEDTIIGTIGAKIKGILPQNCYANIYVSSDKVIHAHFEDIHGDYVDPKSLNKFRLVDTKTDELTKDKRFVLLSDLIGNEHLEGVSKYNNLAFDWQIIKSFESDNLKPDMVTLINIGQKDPYDNSIANTRDVLFGDRYYNDILSGTYPQDDFPPPFSLDDWFMSGIINESNPDWHNIEYLVDADPHLYGTDYGDPVYGFPWNWFYKRKKRHLKFNDFIAMIPGWWRPDSSLVTPSGILNEYGEIDKSIVDTVTFPYPDFYINGIKFYKIFRFDRNSEVLGSDMRIYTYQTKPVNGVTTNDKEDYYPHNMKWVFTSKYTPVRAVQEAIPTVSGYADDPHKITGKVKVDIPDNAKYIDSSIKNVHYKDDNLYLDEIRQYKIIKDNDKDVFIDLSPLENSDLLIEDHPLAFEYAYNLIDNYTSYWDGYIIVDDETVDITLKQSYAYTNQINKYNVVNKYKIINVDTDEVITKNDDVNNKDYNMLDESVKTITLDRGIYEFKIHCLTEKDNAYPANKWSPNSSDFIKVTGNARIVADIKPLHIVTLETLLYSTTYENDYRCAVITDSDYTNYVIVKEPSKNIVPGYYFDSEGSYYNKLDEHQIQNIGHYKRRWYGAQTNIIETYYTGSKIDTIMSGYYYDNTSYEVDYKWNKGKTYDQHYKNTYDKLYPQHSTFGVPINVDEPITNVLNSGYLFHNTSENLPSFYTAEYGLVDRDNVAGNRFLYKIELISEDEQLTPVLDEIEFSINPKIEELLYET